MSYNHEIHQIESSDIRTFDAMAINGMLTVSIYLACLAWTSRRWQFAIAESSFNAEKVMEGEHQDVCDCTM